MSDFKRLIRIFLLVFSWLVRVVGIALFLLVAVIFVGEGPPNPFELSVWELIGFLGILVTLTGVVLALWRQLIGGILILAGMLPFIDDIEWSSSAWVFCVFILLGILNIICWLLRKVLRK